MIVTADDRIARYMATGATYYQQAPLPPRFALGVAIKHLFKLGQSKVIICTPIGGSGEVYLVNSLFN